MKLRAYLLLLAAGLFAQDSRSVEIAVPATQAWTDTAVDLNAGDSVSATATGSITVSGKINTPDGAQRGWADVVKAYPLNEAGRGALIGRIGNSETALVFLVGSRKRWNVPKSGRLYLGINLSKNDTGSDAFQVTLEVTAGKVNPAMTHVRMPRIPDSVLNELPRRVTDKMGNQGDAINFLLLGSDEQVKLAYKNAGWVVVDKTPKAAVVHGLLSTLSKQAYVEMPMSELTLFGRVQDYGYAHAEPVQVVQSRHHLRIWKSSNVIDGRPLWVGAATHDIGFERDLRNNGVTHKIDPEIDGEREYLGQTLSETGLVAKMDYLTPPNAVKDARTATGEAFHSDGRILVILLTADLPQTQ